MASDGGKHTRLPCLATVRSLVAIVVTVLAVAVVVMLIVVVHRPVKVSLELPNGYIRAENQWVAKTKCFAQPAKDVKLRVLLRILNPSGRGDITCNITSMVVFDMPNSSSMGMNISETFYPEKPPPFSVSQHASHTLLQRMIINDTDALNYIYRQYEGENSFDTMVQVNISCKAPPPARHGQPLLLAGESHLRRAERVHQHGHLQEDNRDRLPSRLAAGAGTSADGFCWLKIRRLE